MASVSIYGIRHHGPGSARRLIEALSHQQPDLVLVEGPPEGNAILELAAHPELLPPVAMLLYRPDRPEQAAYYPFASFSPEWQAIQWAHQQGVPLRFIDLSPAYAWKQAESTTSNPPVKRVDWLGQIAQQAGFDDGERWWEATIEQRAGEAQTMFAAVLDLMRSVRQQQDWEATVDAHTLLREAHMRREIRKASKQAADIAVVCGAFHAPVLADMPPAKQDQALLKGLKKAKTAATWIPWTYERLSLRSGYGAGVRAPAWYELCFALPPEQRLSTWMTQAVHWFRAQGFEASPAHAIEAARLAHALTQLRGQPQPRLVEMRDAVQSTLAQGQAAPMQGVEQALIIGDCMGKVPEDVPELPLQRHVRAEQKRLRMRPKAGEVALNLDLRQDFHRAKSHLLHRLNLLDVSWGQLQEVEGALGTFRENWLLHWGPDCELALIEAAYWGNTLAQACQGRIRKTLKQGMDLPQLSTLLGQVFLADLPDVIPILIRQLQQLAATDRDPDHLLETLPALVQVLRYGDVRALPISSVRPVIDSLAPRLMISLPDACRQLDEDFARHRFSQLLRVHQAVQQLRGRAQDTGEQDYQASWQDSLQKLHSQTGTHPLLAGLALRLLYEQGGSPADAVRRSMAQTLSPGTEVNDAAAWIEGFLHGNAALLLHQPALWALLDQWVSDLGEGRFQAVLPLLRRTFAQFSPPERRRLGQMARHPHTASATAVSTRADLDPRRSELVNPILDQLLG